MLQTDENQIPPATSAAGEGDVLAFPPGFLWGAATAAYQIEGAARDDGRGTSIWDTFSREPGRVASGHTGDVACDHYHRYPEDVALMADLGLARLPVLGRLAADPAGRHGPGGAPRPRLLRPARRRAAAAAASNRWSRSTTGTCRSRSRTAAAGPAGRPPYRFAEYAEIVHARARRPRRDLDDPQRALVLGLPRLRGGRPRAGPARPGRRASPPCTTCCSRTASPPGRCAPRARATARHHAQPRVGLARRPQDAADVAAARLVDGLANRIFLDPILRGGYPDDVREHVARVADPAFVHDGDVQVIAAPIDLLGINYYTPTYVAGRPGGGRGRRPTPAPSSVAFLPPSRPGDRRWAGRSSPTGCADLLDRVSADYPGVPLLITENGAAYSDDRSAATARRRDGVRVPDLDRIRYLDEHLRRRARRGQRRGGPARVLRLVAARQLRVGVRVRQALRHRARRLPHPAPAPEGQRPLVPRRHPPQRARRAARLTVHRRRGRGPPPAP